MRSQISIETQSVKTTFSMVLALTLVPDVREIKVTHLERQSQ